MKRSTELVPPYDIKFGEPPALEITMSDKDKAGMAALGELICRMNPYTKQPYSDTIGFQTGEMEVGMLPQSSSLAGAQTAREALAAAALSKQEKDAWDKAKAKEKTNKSAAVAETFTADEKQALAKVAKECDPHLPSIAEIAIEVARNYGEQWNFKGQMRTVKSAIQIPYRFPVQAKDGTTLYWQTEFLLIGYAGGGGMG
jgi:hypothetical protein